MFKTLSAGAISVSAKGLEESVAAARIGGFEGVEFSAHEVAQRIETNGVESVRAVFDEAGIRPGGWGLPVEWRGEEAAWHKSLQELPRLAKAANAIGCPGTMTRILPFSDDKPLEENRAFHVERFTPVAQILADNGCSLGLEFIGPKTMREGHPYPFIHTMQAMLDMGAEIGPNVGLLLDCWHWHTAHGTLEKLRALKAEQVVYVHVNDAPQGIATDEQMDGVRCLPGETGVIDIAGFLQALQAIGYDGPVTPEPFKKELKDLPDDEARLKAVGASMNVIWTRAGLS